MKTSIYRWTKFKKKHIKFSNTICYIDEDIENSWKFNPYIRGRHLPLWYITLYLFIIRWKKSIFTFTSSEMNQLHLWKLYVISCGYCAIAYLLILKCNICVVMCFILLITKILMYFTIFYWIYPYGG